MIAPALWVAMPLSVMGQPQAELNLSPWGIVEGQVTAVGSGDFSG